jgi:hypothetical protein
MGSLVIWGCPHQIREDPYSCERLSGGLTCFKLPDKVLEDTKRHFALVPQYDPNGTPLTYWRYLEDQVVVGGIMTGHGDHPLTAPLLHAYYRSLYAFNDERDLLSRGIASTIHPDGKGAPPRYLQMLKDWTPIFEHLQAAGWLEVRDVDAKLARARLRRVREVIEEFYNSSRTRAIVFFPAHSKAEPLQIPVYSIASSPLSIAMKMPMRILPPQQVTAMGRIYYSQLYEYSRQYWKKLWPHFQKNLKEVELLHIGRFHCKHQWYQLFDLQEQSVVQRQMHLYILLQQFEDLSVQRKEYCNAQNLARFQEHRKIQQQIEELRKTIEEMNEAFRGLFEHYRLGMREVDDLAELNKSTIIDAFLRGEIPKFVSPIRTEQQLSWPQDILSKWMRDHRRFAWSKILEWLQPQGHFFASKNQLAGILHHPYTLFRAQSSGSDYIIRPYYLVGGSFAILLDRARNAIEILSPHHDPTQALQPTTNPTIPTDDTSSSTHSNKPDSSAQPRDKIQATKGDNEPPPEPEIQDPFYRKLPTNRHIPTSQSIAFTRTSARRQTTYRSLYHIMREQCPANVPLTPIHHVAVSDIPSLPALAEQSFAFYNDFLWIRLGCSAIAIPVRKTKPHDLLATQQRQIARIAEQAIISRDAIPIRIDLSPQQAPQIHF